MKVYSYITEIHSSIISPIQWFTSYKNDDGVFKISENSESEKTLWPLFRCQWYCGPTWAYMLDPDSNKDAILPVKEIPLWRKDRREIVLHRQNGSDVRIWDHIPPWWSPHRAAVWRTHLSPWDILFMHRPVLVTSQAYIYSMGPELHQAYN